MKIPAIGDVFTLYRTLYRAECERSLRLQSELTDAHSRLDAANARADRAECERSEAYRRFINFQARGQVFPLEGGEPPQAQPPHPPIDVRRTAREAQVDGLNSFMRDLRDELSRAADEQGSDNAPAA